MKALLAAGLFIGFAGISSNAQAAGCVSGAAIGGVAGHYAGHHGVLGAAAGCAVGHHARVQQERAAQQQQAPVPDNANRY